MPPLFSIDAFADAAALCGAKKELKRV